MRLEFEWQEAPGVRDKVLAASWARLSLSVGDLCASEAIDLRSESRRTGIYGSLFPLAEWIIEHWWHLLYEPSPCSPVPAGRAAPERMRSWVQRHNFLAARDGGSLPDLTISRDGDAVLIQWEADPLSRASTRIRFVGQGRAREDAAQLEESLGSFIDSVLGRLGESLRDNKDVDRVTAAWSAIRSADSVEAELCRSLAAMGVDPYDPEEATETLIAIVQRAIDVLPGELRADFFEGSDLRDLQSNLDWVEQAVASLRGTIGCADFPTIDPVTALTAHDIGYLSARRVRSEFLGLAEDAPVPDLAALLVSRLGWAPGCSRAVEGPTRLDGIVGLDNASSAPLLLTAGERSGPAQRFRLARAAFFPVTRSLGSSARLLTAAVTRPQRASRAFAAELLAPAASLARRISGSLNDEDVEHLAEEFLVSPLVIRHQVENHGLAYLGT